MIFAIYVGIGLFFLILIMAGLVKIVIVKRKANKLKERLHESDNDTTTTDGTTTTGPSGR